MTGLDLSASAFVAADAATDATITFGGFGFQPNESVSLSIAQPGLPLATTVTADTYGSFTYALTVPAHTAAADYTIAATGQASSLAGSGVRLPELDLAGGPWIEPRQRLELGQTIVGPPLQPV